MACNLVKLSLDDATLDDWDVLCTLRSLTSVHLTASHIAAGQGMMTNNIFLLKRLRLLSYQQLDGDAVAHPMLPAIARLPELQDLEWCAADEHCLHTLHGCNQITRISLSCMKALVIPSCMCFCSNMQDLTFHGVVVVGNASGLSCLKQLQAINLLEMSISVDTTYSSFSQAVMQLSSLTRFVLEACEGRGVLLPYDLANLRHVEVPCMTVSQLLVSDCWVLVAILRLDGNYLTELPDLSPLTSLVSLDVSLHQANSQLTCVLKLECMPLHPCSQPSQAD